MSYTAQVLEMADRDGLIRAADVARAGIPTVYLTRLVRSGELQRVARGLYSSPGLPFTEHISLVETARLVPRGVICLVSALRFYDLGTQRPHRVWIALPAHATAPIVATAELEIVRMKDAAFREGVQSESVPGGVIRIFEPSKTIADLFKFRSRVGLDVALEGLGAYLRSPYRDIAALDRFARINRVDNVMRPYLEAMVL